jgi:hypothetical protein
MVDWPWTSAIPPEHDTKMSSTQSRIALLLQAVVAVALTTAVLLPAKPSPAVVLTAGDAIGIAQGISVTPAQGWTLGHRGPNWVALSNADGSAQLRVAVKPAGGADPAAALQADMDQYTSSAGLSNLSNVTAPNTQPVQSPNFQQEASVDYTAEVPSAQGSIPVLGTFTELLNTSTGRSAFIDFRQNNNATPQAVDDGAMMIRSLE